MNFNEKLIELRKEKSWSQEEFGEKLDVTRQTVSKWELGQTTPEMQKLIDISKLFNLSIDELVGNNNSQIQNETPYDEIKIKCHGIEYKSKRKIGNLPLVHINWGFGPRVAKGVIAIGNTALGIVSLGLCSVGIVSLGLCSVGLLVFGLISLGLGAFGAISLGLISFGAISVGYIAVGALTTGAFSVGGYAVATQIAIGGYAEGHIAIGDKVNGDFKFANYDEMKKEELEKVREKILQEYPNFPENLLDLITDDSFKD